MRKLGQALTRFSVDRGWVITLAMLVSTFAVVALAVLPTVAPDTFSSLHPAAVDTDPENMLSPDEPARVIHHKIKDRFGINDGIVVGLVNEKHPQGVFNVETLKRVHAITEFVKTLDEVVKHDIMSLSTVDDIKNTGAGEMRFAWLMDTPPTTEEEAAYIGERAMRIPFLNDSLVAKDGKVVAIYVPLKDKHAAHDVMLSIQEKVAEIGLGDDGVHYAGLPVAESTFGVEMFKQMAVSAPVAMLIIFLLMWFFFKKLILIVAPMIVAMVAALTTIGLLVVTGNTIHIMSSMIPIFIMPIAVLNSIHIISDFFEKYQETKDRRKTIMHVMDELNAPMLFTSLTTTAGFGSLALTPIPPVQTFGIFIAIGVMLSWLWTITFIPAFIGLLNPERLENFGKAEGESDEQGPVLGALNALTYKAAAPVMLVVLGIAGVAGWGISQININDNPVRWFEKDHAIRKADTVMNAHFGGTYDAYLTVQMPEADYSATAYGDMLKARAAAQAETVAAAFAAFDGMAKGVSCEDGEGCLDALDDAVRQKKKSVKEAELPAWAAVASFIEDEYAELEDEEAPAEGEAPAFDAKAFGAQLAAKAKTRGGEVARAFERLDAQIAAAAKGSPADAEAFLAAVRWEAETSADRAALTFVGQAAQFGEVFKDPEALAWLEKFEEALVGVGVGKTNSLAGIVKTVHRDLISGQAEDYRLPTRRGVVAQTLEQFTSSHRKDDLWKFVTPDYRAAVVWLQLQSGDNQSMVKVIEGVDQWVAENPPPLGLEKPTWSGLSYINVAWQEKMVSGMMEAFGGSFIVVLIMMVFLFRSLLWGILSMIPLTVTVGVCYGALGIVGKDYDMPVAVLSSLSLGLAVDYAIHFLARSRELHRRHGSWEAARGAVFGEPARAISRNVIVVGVGFLPLVLAPLVPYQTVGILIAAILLLAGGATLIILPSLIRLMSGILFKEKGSPSAPKTSSAAHSA